MAKLTFKGKAPFPKVKIKTTDIDLKEIEVLLKGKIVSALHKATERTAAEISEWLDEAFDAEIYDWPRETKRFNGDTVSSPRDIVDLGTLKNSKKVKTRYGVTFGEVTIEYNTKYASYVYYGAYIYPYGRKERERVYTPGRPWVSYALTGTTDPSNNDIGKYIRALRRNLDLAAE